MKNNLELILKSQEKQRSYFNLLQGTQLAAIHIQNTFKSAEWKFYCNNQFIFTPSSTFKLPSELFPILGIYSKIGEIIKFQGEKIVDKSSVSIDGTIHFNGDNFVLDAIYTLSLQSDSQQIVRVSQTLTRQSFSTVKESKLERKSILIEPQPVNNFPNIPEINDSEVEITQIFKILLNGQTEVGKFDSLPGFLFLTPSKDSQLPINVQLSTNPEFLINHGGIHCNFEEFETLEPNIQIEGNEHQFCIRVREGTPQVTWYTLPLEQSSNDPVPVIIENAVLSLKIQRDEVVGEIKGSGFYSTNSSELYPSTYEAKFTGELEKSSLVENLRTKLETLIFTGCWHTDIGTLGEIELQQEGKEVKGSYTGLRNEKGGIITGILQGNRLDFTWTEDESEGWGFFRFINSGGTIIGLLSSNDFSSPSQSLVATWQLPTFLEEAILDSVDMRELRWLGHELVIQNRREKAVAVLDLALNLYREERLKPETPSQKQTECLLNEAVTLAHFLPNCNFLLGNYDKLLENLEHMLEVLQWLSPEESASRLFQERTAELVKTLKSQSGTFEIFENGFTTTKKEMSGSSFRGMVGIYLEKDDQSNFLKVWDTVRDSSAHIANILPQDIIVAIDDCSTKNMDVEQAKANLSGEPQTQVKLKVRRENQELEYILVRKRIEIYPPHRLDELVEYLTIFANYFGTLQNRVKTYLQKLSETETRIARGQADPVEALISLGEDIAEQRMQLNVEIDELFVLRTRVYQDNKRLLEDVESLLRIFPRNLNEFSENTFAQREIALLDQKIVHCIDNDNNFSTVEKILFKEYIQSILVITTFFFDLDCQHQFLSKIDARKLFKENRQRSQEMSSRLTIYLERWRSQLIEDLDKIDALEKGQPFFQKLVPFLIELGNISEALVASETSRARAFADLLATKADSTNDAETIPQSIAANSPTLEQIKQIAQEQRATLIEYAIIYDLESQHRESKLFIWVIQPTGKIEFSSIDLELLKQTNKISLEKLVDKARASIGIKEKQSTDFNSAYLVNNKCFYPHLQQLYQVLIESIINFLPNDPNVPLIFIPQSFLFLIPFSALQDKKGDFLIQKYTILTAPSIQVLDLTRQPKKEVLKTSINALVAGNPTMPSLARAINEEPQQLKTLPASEAEAKAIASLLNTQAFVADQATKVNIVQQMPKARLIHLATHGILDDLRQLKMPGAIALAPCEDDNGFLTAGEIMEMFGQPHKPILQAELLVLSACVTGLGKVTGDGVIGLSRTLMAAGVSRVIVSLWAVSDLSTAFLMIKFHEILKNFVHLEPADVAKSLNQAQKWLASLSRVEAKQEFEKLKPHIYQAFVGRSPRVAQAYINRYLKICDRDPYPFAKPTYWAAFTTIGL
ncbi:MAG: CHAT domain-containing protein [Xenococcus sp. MO_188.B8]|nr:CHAT domain-containing protein [Xenococcus sp. MO_188.B8]